MHFGQWIRKNWQWLVLPLVLWASYLWEENLSWKRYAAIVPFPDVEYWLLIIDGMLRDLILVIAGYFLYLRRSRIPDRLRRYFPVVVIGVGYLAFAAYMVVKLEMDRGFLTLLAVLAGLNNNILLVLLAAMFYHREPTGLMLRFYQLVYLTMALVLGVDVIYFWQTSMHVQAVFFRNLNIYAAEGVLSSFSAEQGEALLAAVVVIFLLFQVSKPTRHKPNFVWSLLCVAAFTLTLNLLYSGGKQLVMFSLKETGLWSEEQVEKSRQEYRDMLALPIVPDIMDKAMFSKEKIIRKAVSLDKRELTETDKRLMLQLGVMRQEEPVPLEKPAYDRIVFLILESVHRDFLHHYNEKIPAEATPYLDHLVETYPHIDHYYSSAIPTTEGLNSTFRSLLIFDNDIAGEGQPTLYRSVQDAGYEGVFLSASSRYYNNEFKEYKEQFGMQQYYAREDLEKMGYTGASGWGFHNDVMYDATIKMLKEMQGKYFILAAKTLDMHQPYPYYATAWEDTPESFRMNETVTIHGMYWVDSTIKKFFEEASASGLMDDRTLFIITSDHNPHSGGEYTKLVDKPEDKQSIAPIPLIFVAQNLAPLNDLKTNTYASQIDLAPTLLCLLGIKPPARFLGRNLLQTYEEPDNAIGFFGDKAFYYSEELNFVDNVNEPYPAHDYEDSFANFVMYSYYQSSLKN